MQEIVLQILEFFAGLGYLGVALGLMIEVIPSEIVLAYGGFMVAQGNIGFVGAVIAGTIGGTFAQLFLYWFGYYGGRSVVLKYGKYILIKEKHVLLAEKWFEQYGSGVVFSARFIPVVRHAISIPAGISKMNIWKFTFYTAVAAVPWSIFFIYIGMKLGNNWSAVKEVTAPYILPLIIGAIGMLVVFLLIKRFRPTVKKV